MRNEIHDIGVIGAGPAGLSAALLLARCTRTVLVLDNGHPRNAAAAAIHGFLGMDGMSPAGLRSTGRKEVSRYGVHFIDDTVTNLACIQPTPTLFVIRTGAGRDYVVRKLVLATGMRDKLPTLNGISDFYGRSVHHCPYCDGYEHRGKRLAAYGTGDEVAGLALSLRTWSPYVTACSENDRVPFSDHERLEKAHIPLRTERISTLNGASGQLTSISFFHGADLACDALFFQSTQQQQSSLPEMLGCRKRDDRQLETHEKQRSSAPGVFVIGDADGDLQFAVVAAAEGAKAAVAINRDLQTENGRG